MDPWETLHRWEWFRRSQWLTSFREQRQTISLAVSNLLQELGCADGLLLDCSCGLGFHSITFKEMGLHVHGAYRSAFAVNCAQELAHAEGHQMSFFVSDWRDLSTRSPQRYDAIFCDALSWVTTHDEMEEALQGLQKALHPEGALLFLGAPEGVTREQNHQGLQEAWRSKPPAPSQAAPPAAVLHAVTGGHSRQLPEGSNRMRRAKWRLICLYVRAS